MLEKETDEEPVDPTHYRKIVGCLTYLYNTRPDLNFSVGLINRFMQEPRQSHLLAAKRIMRKSTAGYIFFYGGAPISWSSTKEPVVALSSCEAEYIAASEATCQAVWLDALIKELQLEKSGKVKLLVDNKSVIDLAKHPASHGRSTHIETNFHFLKEQVNNEKLKIEHYRIEVQLADILTKALKLERFRCLRDSIGVVCVNATLN